MNGARHRRIYPPVGRPLASFFAIHDGSKSVSLLVVRPLIDDGLTLAVALVNRPRPAIEESCAEAIERDISKVSLIDAYGREAATVSVRGTRGLELARTSVIAIAIADLHSFDVPVNQCHGVLRQSDYPVNMVLLSYWVNPTSEMRPMLMAASRWLGGFTIRAIPNGRRTLRISRARIPLSFEGRV